MTEGDPKIVETIVICSICGKWFNNLKQCEEHLTSHTESQTIGCNLCEDTFTTQLELEWHYETEHESPLDNEPKVQCGICYFKAESQGVMEEHIVAKHTFPCKLCHLTAFQSP